MIDLTPVFVGIISLVSVTIAAFVIPYVRKKLENEKADEIFKWVTIAVKGVEQLANANAIPKEQRKATVVKFLREHGYDLDADKIDMMIEAAVNDLTKYLDAIVGSTDDDDGENEDEDEEDIDCDIEDG